MKNYYLNVLIVILLILMALPACELLFPDLAENYLIVELDLPELAGLFAGAYATDSEGVTQAGSDLLVLDENGCAVSMLLKDGKMISFKTGTSLTVSCNVREGSSAEDTERYYARKVVLIDGDSKVIFTGADNMLTPGTGTPSDEITDFQVRAEIINHHDSNSYHCLVRLHDNGTAVENALVTINGRILAYESDQQYPENSCYILQDAGKPLPGGLEIELRILKDDYNITETFTMPRRATDITPDSTIEDAFGNITLNWNNGIPLYPLPDNLYIQIDSANCLQEDYFYANIAANSISYNIPPNTLKTGLANAKIEITSQNYKILTDSAYEENSFCVLINNGFTYFDTKPLTSLKALINVINGNEQGLAYLCVEAVLTKEEYQISDAVVTAVSQVTLASPLVLEYFPEWDIYRYFCYDTSFIPGEIITIRIQKDDLDITVTCVMSAPLQDFTPWNITVDPAVITPVRWTLPEEELDFIYLSIFSEHLIADYMYRDETILPSATDYDLPAGILSPGTNGIALYVDAGKRFNLLAGANGAVLDPGSVLDVVNVIIASFNTL